MAASDLNPAGPTLYQDGTGEFRCDECGRRCTRGPSGTEYGHRRGLRERDDRCSQRPDSVDPVHDAEGGQHD